MLSRVADSLYWMARYLERAEHTARLLDLNLHWLLDQAPPAIRRRWERVLHSLRVEMHLGLAQDLQEVGRALAFDADMPDSILSCVAAARKNAREAREQVSSEMWEQLNRLYLRVRELSVRPDWESQPHEFFQQVKQGIYLFQGTAASTISHDACWQFIKLGQYLERTVATAHLLDVHFRTHRTSNGSIGVEQYLEWVGLLKSCTAFEAFCRQYSADVQPSQVAEFLLLDATFPHSVRYGATRVQDALEKLAESTPTLRGGQAVRLAGRLAATLSYDHISEVLQNGLPAYLADVQHHCIQVHEAVYETCIAYPVEAAL